MKTVLHHDHRVSLAVTISKEDLAKLPLLAFSGKIHLPRSLRETREAVNHLSKESVVGFDTETRPSFKKGQFFHPSLVQISTETEAFLFQFKKMESLTPMLEFLENSKILKTGVALDRDIKELIALVPFKAEGFLELGRIARQAGLEKTGLRNMCGILLGHRISKKAQTSNWARSELTDEQILYAATDAWVSLKLYQRLRQHRPDLFTSKNLLAQSSPFSANPPTHC